MYRALFVAASLVVLAGCESTEQQLDAQQAQAVQTAVQRVGFDMNCPTATGQVISREMLQPVSIRFGVERAEYTVGVEGCESPWSQGPVQAMGERRRNMYSAP